MKLLPLFLQNKTKGGFKMKQFIYLDNAATTKARPEVVEAMPSREKQIPKLKALLEHFEVTDLATAAGLAEHIGDYILTPEISSPQEAAIDELNFTMDAHSAELLLPHVNLFTYGNEIIKDDNAALTSYGLLHREDYQPMQTPVQETQEQAMTME